jgi:hypothetical protein
MVRLFQLMAKNDPIAVACRIFLQDHAIGTLWHRGAGKDTQGFARRHLACEGVACARLADDAEPLARQVVRLADRIAIHGRGVERRLGQAGLHRGRQNPARSLSKRHGFTAKRQGQRNDPPERFFN